MFRIHFEPKGGYWCIQFLRWGFRWVTVKVRGEEPLLEVLRFPTFSAAAAYVEEQGISEVYRDRTGSPPAAGFDSSPVPTGLGRNHISSFVRRGSELRHTDFFDGVVQQGHA